ncbi:hypothetical protein JRQ81_007948, partial [Phrynocephalus forsythii]
MEEMRQTRTELASLRSMGLQDVMRRMDDLSNELQSTKQDLSNEIKQTQTAVDTNGRRLENLAGEFKNLETRVTKNETEISSQKQALLTTKKKLTYMEDYSRRQNVKLINFVAQKKGELKQEVITWLNSFLPKLEEEDIERVHYLGNLRDGTPRPVIARFFSYVNKEYLMSSIRANPNILKRGDATVQVYQDLSKETSDWRKSMKPVTTILQKHNYRYSWGHPLFLKVWKGSIQHTIHSLEEGQHILEALNIQDDSASPSLSPGTSMATSG